MGRRGARAAFMPSKHVFPGGAVDPGDGAVPLGTPLPASEAEALRGESEVPPGALAAAAIRELWEESGLRLSVPGAWPGPPPDWAGFAAGGHLPHAAALRFVFRAITPPGRPRRFDARFLMADAGALSGDPDDFSAADDELSGLAWIPLSEAGSLDLPFVTEVALAEVAARLSGVPRPGGVPFFRNDDEASLLLYLGRAPQD